MNLCTNETYEKSSERSRSTAPDCPTVKDSLKELKELLLKIEGLSGRIADVVGVEPGDPTEDKEPCSIAEALTNDCVCAARSLRKLSEICALLGIEL